MTFRTPMLRRLAVLCVLAAMLVAATGCTALKNGTDKPDLGVDLGIARTDLGPVWDSGDYDDAGAVDSSVPDFGSPDQALFSKRLQSQWKSLLWCHPRQ